MRGLTNHVSTNWGVWCASCSGALFTTWTQPSSLSVGGQQHTPVPRVHLPEILSKPYAPKGSSLFSGYQITFNKSSHESLRLGFDRHPWIRWGGTSQRLDLANWVHLLSGRVSYFVVYIFSGAPRQFLSCGKPPSSPLPKPEQPLLRSESFPPRP